MADEEDELVLFDDAVAEESANKVDDDGLNAALAEAAQEVVTPPAAVAPKDDVEEEDSFFDNAFQDDDEAPREAHGDVLPPSMEIERLLLKHDLTREYMTPIVVNKSSVTFGPRMENDRSVIAFKKSLSDQTLGEEELALRQRIWTRYKEMMDDLQEMSSVNLSKSVSNFYDEDNNNRQRSRLADDDDDDDDDDDVIDIEKFKAAPPPPRRKRAADYFIRKPLIARETKPVVEESSVLKNTFEQLNDEEDEDDAHYFARIEGEGEGAVVEELSDDGLDKRPRLENRFIMQVEEGSEEEDGDVEIYDEDDKGKEEEDE
jgi:hypothetical protein